MTNLTPIKDTPYTRCPHCKDEHEAGLTKCPHCRYRYNDQANFARVRLLGLIAFLFIFSSSSEWDLAIRVMFSSISAIALSYALQGRHTTYLEALRRWPNSGIVTWILSYTTVFVTFITWTVFGNPGLLLIGVFTLTAFQTLHIIAVSPPRQVLPLPQPLKPGEHLVACPNCNRPLPNTQLACNACGHFHQQGHILAKFRLGALICCMVAMIAYSERLELFLLPIFSTLALIASIVFPPKETFLEVIGRNGALAVATWVASATFLLISMMGGWYGSSILAALLPVSQYFHIASMRDLPREQAVPPRISP